MVVRLPADWMTQADERLLELLEESPDARSPTQLTEDDRLSFSRQYINSRLKRLENGGLVRNLGNGMYVITDSGAEFLIGEFDASELDPDD